MLLFLESLPYLVAALFGVLVGSFVNVCIYRIPAGESVVTAPSHCMSCGQWLLRRDLVPVFSWLYLRGRCRYCGARISAQYPLIEAANGLLWVLVCLSTGFSALSLIYCLMASALLTLSVIDARTQIIPFGINVFLFLLGIVAAILDGRGVLCHIVGLFCVSVPFLLLQLVSGGGAIGGGDVKLLAACGLILGWQRILLSLILGCILGSVIHLLRMRFAGAGRTLAFGPYLAAGIFLGALYGDRMISWYLGLLT